MKLYVTPKSAFAWVVRIVVLEKRLEDKINIKHNRRERCPKLAEWADALIKRPSVARALPGRDGRFFDPPQPKI